MWPILLAALLLAAAIHSRFGNRSGARTAELVLVYVLAGYCGLAQIGYAVATVVAPPEWQIEHLPRVQPGNPIMSWFALLLLGMGTIAILTIRYRGAFLAAPLIAWSIFWGGATIAHGIHDPTADHPLGFHDFIHIFVAHGLVAVVLVGFGLRLWRAK